MVKRREINKKAQSTMGMPFGVIFAIFLIIVFFMVAFFAIRGFLDTGKSVSVLQFYEDFQDEVTSVWRSQTASKDFQIKLPKGVEMVCFSNLSAPITGSSEVHKQIRHFEFYGANVFIIPISEAQGMEYKEISYLDIAKTTEKENPYCVLNGEKIKLEKDFYDRLVCIGEGCSKRQVDDRNINIGRRTERSICEVANRDDKCDWLALYKDENYASDCCREFNKCC